MLKLITGIPGSGKTLYAVSELKKIIDKNNKLPPNQRRLIYCDITDLKIDGVLPNPPLDWRTTPEKTLLIYDEAQFNKPFQAGRGLSPYKYIEDLTIHRKTAHEIWYITQDPKRLHSNILEMVEQHFHLDRPYGAKLATVFQFRGAERTPRSRSATDRAERKFLFKYNKDIFKLYKSSEVDDGIKLRLPFKLVAFCLLPVALFGFSAFTFFGGSTQRMVKGESLTNDSSIAVVAPPRAAPVGTIPNDKTPKPVNDSAAVNNAWKVAKVVSDGVTCTAYDPFDKQVILPLDQCLQLNYNHTVSNGIPSDLLRPIYIEPDS